MSITIQEYLRRAEQDPTFAGRRETQDVRNALQSIAAYQTTRGVGEALGVDASAQPRKGLMTRVLGDILGAPARGVRAGIADIIGFDDPRLREQGVLGSVARGIRGDIDITGGDFIDADRARGRLGRAARLGGAFAIDVLTDPITYVGTPAALGRKAAMTQAGFMGKNILNTSAQALSRSRKISSKEAMEELTEQLFKRSEAGKEFSNLAKRGTPEERLKELLEQRGGQPYKLEIASREMGSIVGETLWSRGRAGVVDELTTVLGSRKIAEEVFTSLPDRIRGGLFLANPFTGATITRLSPGTGAALGQVGRAVNVGRAKAAERAGRLTQGISGVYGESFQLLRSDLAKLADMPAGSVLESRKMTLAAFIGKKEMDSLERAMNAGLARQFFSVASEATVLREQLKMDPDVFNRQMIEGILSPDVAREGVNPLVHAMGRKVTIQMQSLRKQMTDAGYEVGNLGESYIPQVMTKEGAEMFARQTAEAAERALPTGGGTGDGTFNMLKGRMTNMRALTDLDTAAEYGFVIDDLLALEPRLANIAQVGRQFDDLAIGGESQALVRDFFNRKIEEAAAGAWEMPTTVAGLVEELAKEGISISANTDLLNKVVLQPFETDILKIFAQYTKSASAKISRRAAIDFAKSAGVVSERLPAEINALSQRVGRQFMIDMQNVNSAVRNNPAIKNLIDNGELTEQHFAIAGILSEDNMLKMMRHAQVDRVLPDLSSQAAVIDEALEAVARMHVASGGVDNRSLAAVRQAADRFTELDSMVTAYDSFIGEMVEKGLSPEQITLLMKTSRDSLRKAQGEVVQDITVALKQAGVEQKQVETIVNELGTQLFEAIPALNPDIVAELTAAGASPKTITRLQAIIRQEMDKAGASLQVGISDPGQVASMRAIVSEEDVAARAIGLERLGATADTSGIVQVPQDFSELRAIKGVRQLIEEKYRLAANPSRSEKFINDVYEPAFLMWKTGATVGRGPGYTFLNMVGNLYMNHLGGVSAADHALSARVFLAARQAADRAAQNARGRGVQVTAQEAPFKLAAETDQIFREILSSEPTINGRTMYSLLQDFVDFGGIESSQIVEGLNIIRRTGAQVTPTQLEQAKYARNIFEEPAASAFGRTGQRTVELVMNNPMQRTFNSINTNVESWTRFAAFVDAYRSSGNTTAALESMFLLQFNYGDLSSGDRILRRVLPFYVWTRNNVPAQFRAMFVQPGKIRRLMAAQDAFKDAFTPGEEDAWLEQVLPEYIGEAGGFATSFKDTVGNNIAFAGKLPYHDVERLFQVGGRFGLVTLNRREIFQMFGPFITGIEMAAGRSYTGGQFDPRGVEATGWRSALGQVPGVGRTGEFGERRIPTGVEKFTSELIPQLGTAERALSGAAYGARALGAPEGLARAIEAPAGATMRERGLSNLLNVSGVSPLLGVSATTLTPRTISSTLRARSTQQQAVIAEAAGRMQVSQEWVRQELRKGFTPEEIAIRIANGEGRIEDWEAERQASQRPPSERYAPILRDLGRGTGITTLGYNRPPTPRPAYFGGR
jgi:hypothetical protein